LEDFSIFDKENQTVITNENVPYRIKKIKQSSHIKLVLIVTGTVTDVPQTLPHLVSGVIIL
jgi:hypothetical protein